MNDLAKPINLIQQKEELNKAFVATALAEPNVSELSVEDFKKLITAFNGLDLDWKQRSELTNRWKEAFLQQQKESPTYVRSILEYKSTDLNIKENATPFREEILSLLHSEDAQEDWFINATRLKIEWTIDFIKKFPLQLVKEYIEQLSRLNKDRSIETEDLLERVKQVADSKLLREVKASIKTRKDEDADSSSDDADEDMMKKEYKYAMKKNEKLLVSIAIVWYEELQKETVKEARDPEGYHEVHFIRSSMRAIYQQTSKYNQCPPGADMHFISAAFNQPTQVTQVTQSTEATHTKSIENEDQNDNSDLISQILDKYKDDPISALRQSSRRQLFFRYGDRCAELSRFSQCHYQTNFGIEFPDLCYVLLTDVEIIYHSPSYQTDEDREKIKFHVGTGTSSIPVSLYRITNQKETKIGSGCESKEQLYTRRISVKEEVCKWIQITTGFLDFVTIHEIRAYGKAIILM